MKVPLTSMDHQRFAREGETAFSPERTCAWPHVAAKEGSVGDHGFPHAQGGEGGRVIPAEFDYERAGSLDEAIELLGREDAKVLAGGQSLIPMLRLRFARPSVLVDVGRLDDLRYVREDGDRIAIGALTRHAELVRDPVLGAELRSHLGGGQARRRPAGSSPRHDRRLRSLTAIRPPIWARSCSRSTPISSRAGQTASARFPPPTSSSAPS